MPPDETTFAELLAVVRREHDDRVAIELFLAQELDEASEGGVDRSELRVIST